MFGDNSHVQTRLASMKNPLLKTVLCAGVLFLGLSAAAPAVRAQGKPGWIDNEAKALEKAKADKKMVLIDFTGSDWCGWCIKMDKEVFSDPAFKQYAADHLVLVELDFPHQKYVAPETKKQNESLAKQYGVEGFPTMVLLDSEGKKVKVFDGYQEGGAKAFIDQLKAAKS